MPPLPDQVMLAFWFVPMFIINLAPESFKLQVNQFLSTINMIQLAAIGIVLLVVVNIGLIWLAMQRFQRTRLILD